MPKRTVRKPVKKGRGTGRKKTTRACGLVSPGALPFLRL